ncbi:hypothetical protein JCM11641_004212 [Rhodosporidiobolus odoratus]
MNLQRGLQKVDAGTIVETVTVREEEVVSSPKSECVSRLLGLFSGWIVKPLPLPPSSIPTPFNFNSDWTPASDQAVVAFSAAPSQPFLHAIEIQVSPRARLTRPR